MTVERVAGKCLKCGGTVLAKVKLGFGWTDDQVLGYRCINCGDIDPFD